jgi:hypothetical protein
VFPEKANGTFRGRRGRQEEVNKRLEEDDQLRKEVDRLKGKKQKEQEANQDQD